MKTKIVYALVSTPNDLYYEQLILSLHSLRKHNPETNVVVVVDRDTYNNLHDRPIKLSDYEVSILVVDTPADCTNMQKNRFIKTNLRNLVVGDFLYVDSDTIICDSLEELDSLECELGAVVDAHSHPYPESVKNYLYENSHLMGWDNILSTTLYNGGLMYAKDTETAHEFYRLWHAHWLECVEKGYSKDQLSLRKTYHDFPVIKRLDDCWNCMVKDHGTPYLEKAKIIHYFYETLNDNYPLSLNSVLATIKLYGTIPPFVEYFLSSPKRMLCSADQYCYLEDSEPIQRLYVNNSKLYRALLWIANHFWGLKSRF